MTMLFRAAGLAHGGAAETSEGAPELSIAPLLTPPISLERA